MKRGIIFSDVHAPFHDVKALNVFVQVVLGLQPDVLICLGDVFDCNALSHYARNPDWRNTFRQDVMAGHAVLALLKAQKMVFCQGNHEDRLKRYTWQRAPEVYEFLRDEHIFRLQDLGWETVPYNRSYKLGNLVATHDFGKWGQNAVKDAMALHPGKVVVIGHTHRLQRLYSGEGGNVITPGTGFSAGWFGDLEKIHYKHMDRCVHEWQHGFLEGHWDDDGNAHFRTVPIHYPDYRCYCNGKIYLPGGGL